MNSEPILIVEDNPINIKLFRVVLEKAGFQVRTAVDANEALAALAEFNPRLILMDVQLPGMDGLELTRRLKADPRYRRIRIVALTAYAMKGDREKASDAGCEGYITKPIDTRTFADSVRRFMHTDSTPAVETQPERKLILIADDDPAQRRLLEIHLTQLGFEVTAVKDGAEAIEKMHERRPSLVASDVLMPRLDGFRLAQFVRQEPALASVPVVLMTSGAIRPDDEDMARSLGANCIVARTEGFDHIVAAIRSALAQGATAATRHDHEVIEELRKRFVEDGLRDSRNLLDTFNSGFDFGATRKLAHRWAGTGGTLGLPQVSQAAFAIERLLAEDKPDTDTVLSKLAAVNDLFSVANRPENTAIVSDAVASSLSGKRFAAIGFDEVEARRLSETLEQAQAVLRVRYAVPDRSEDWTQLYDGVILSFNDGSETLLNSDFLAGIGKPLVAIGSSSPILETALGAHPAEHDFLLRPWNASELVLRCYAVLGRSAALSRLAPTRAAGARANILIGDDDPTTVALLKMTLQNYSMDCEAVSNGGDVIKAVAGSRPDLVVLDVNMPQLDGFEVLSALKNDQKTKSIPVVLLTARQQETDILRGFSLGAEDYVIKPFSPMELVARIKRSLGRTA